MARNYVRVVEPLEERLNEVLREEQKHGSSLVQTLAVDTLTGKQIIFVFEALHRHYEFREPGTS